MASTYKVPRDSHCVLHEFMVHELALKGASLIIYACIYGFSNKEGQWFIGSAGYLAEWAGISRQRVNDILKGMVETGLLEKRSVDKNGVKYCDYRALRPVKKVDRVSNNLTGGCQISLQGGCQETRHHNIDIHNIDSYYSNNIASSADATLADGNKKNASSLMATVASQPPKEKNSAKREKVAELLGQVIQIVKPGQKATASRLKALNARLKDYSEADVIKAAKNFANDEWRNRPENRQYMSVDYLLAPTKFSRWAEMDSQQPTQKKSRWI